MPRKAHIVKREIVPDPVHDSTLLTKFVEENLPATAGTRAALP